MSKETSKNGWLWSTYKKLSHQLGNGLNHHEGELFNHQTLFLKSFPFMGVLFCPEVSPTNERAIKETFDPECFIGGLLEWKGVDRDSTPKMTRHYVAAIPNDFFSIVNKCELFGTWPSVYFYMNYALRYLYLAKRFTQNQNDLGMIEKTRKRILENASAAYMNFESSHLIRNFDPEEWDSEYEQLVAKSRTSPEIVSKQLILINRKKRKKK